MDDSEEVTKNVYNHKKNENTWWTDEYKMARTFLYGTKEISPDFEKALNLMMAESEKGMDLQCMILGKHLCQDLM